ncbi:MAG: MOSC domain-containing protein [Herpetosiphonaceae bacterium]|nr:MOSC domain-containing protein [Herpetosiphonaceae bacterium]
MIHIHTLLIGLPQTITDANGTWRSAIFRQPINGPIELGPRGLAGDQVADTEHHGAPGQAVCCHPLEHYDYWNRVYSLTTPDRVLRAGSVGENWTLSNLAESAVCVGDIVRVGSAIVQVSGPRYPCAKQERKLGLPGFLKATVDTLRTGFYLRVLKVGVVQAGDQWMLEERMHPDLTIEAINRCAHHRPDRDLVARMLVAEELGEAWKHILTRRLKQHDADTGA